jgi:putative phosphoesterase
MRIGVMSDTHGDQAAVRQAMKAVGHVDMWLHAGDYSQDARYLAKLVTVPVFAARGNCDGQATAKIDEFIEVAGKRIWLTHGHRYGVKQGIRELVQWSRQYEMDAVIYGHTHVPDNQWDEQLMIFNPGSAAQPRSGYGTCGVLDINHEGKMVGRIFVFDS